MKPDFITGNPPCGPVGPATPRRLGGSVGAPQPGGSAVGTRIRHLQTRLGATGGWEATGRPRPGWGIPLLVGGDWNIIVGYTIFIVVNDG